jgi:hypothetical protein
MALNFSGLNETPGLYDDIGSLKERWAQEDSTVFNLTTDFTSDKTIYTVTAGKRLYIKNIFCQGAGTTGNFELRDGGAGGTMKISIYEPASAQEPQTIYFEVPLYFDTDIYCNEGGACNGYITLTGWEEDRP